MPTTTAVLSIPANIPITLEGPGNGSSSLEPAVYSAAPNYDIIAVGNGATGFSIHDLGFVYPASATAGSVIHVPGASTSSFYNLRFVGAYDDIELGRDDNAGTFVEYTNVRGISSLNGGHCFLRLDGGVADTYVRGTYAEANGALNSQILCLPSTLGPLTQSKFGLRGLFISDSTFSGFARGFSIPANQTVVSDMVLDDLYIGTTIDGPAFELFLPPGSPSTVSDIRVSNSMLQSAATACIIHGAATSVTLNSVVCNSGIASARPGPCPLPPYPRGFALVEINGSGTSTQSFTVNVTAPGMSGSATLTPTTALTAAQAASALGAVVNASSLVSTTGCPLLIPVQSFNDHGPIVNNSIGNDIELFSYAWGSTVTPAISVSTAGSGPLTITVPNVVSTFSPADGVYVGSPSTSSPSNIAITGSSGINAANGAGLHVQGGASMVFTNNTFGDVSSPDEYAVQVDTSAVSYTGIQFQNNSFANATVMPPVYFNPALGTTTGQVIRFSGNLGYDPTGQQATPTVCGGTLINPYPFAAEVYISGAFTSVTKSGTTIYTGSGSAQNVAVWLGVGESIKISCTTPPTVTWFGQ
jgi:hypothetical protein